MPVTVEDVDLVFRFASMFYHNQTLFKDVVRFRLRVLGVRSFNMIMKPLHVIALHAATESVYVIEAKELWKLQLPDKTYTIIVETHYALEDCDDLELCLKLQPTLKPLWYRVVGVAEGDLEEVEGVEEGTGED
jgi:hypothetical protein